MTTPVFQIVPTTQKYDWGKVGLKSKVAQFAHAARDPGFTLEENSPYAEVYSDFIYMKVYDILTT